jgi:hypothetical protein
MTKTAITFILANYSMTFFVIGLIASLIAIARLPRPIAGTLIAPEHLAGEMRSVARNCQGECCRDADRGRDIERRAVRREVADGAIDCAAAELDRSAF